jgi:riboflavin synthase
VFTGIIEATGTILSVSDGTITVERPVLFHDITLGASINVSGVCLTIVDVEKNAMRFDIVQETIAKTTLGALKTGDRVNLERAMSAGSRLDGHVVQGHVEGVGEVITSGPTLMIRLPDDLLPSIVPKGSIAIDGVSLTIAAVEDNTCSVALIPYTIEHTTLGSLRVGDRVNIETDILLRWAAHAQRNDLSAA